jgi:hypothetical protein
MRKHGSYIVPAQMAYLPQPRRIECCAAKCEPVGKVDVCGVMKCESHIFRNPFRLSDGRLPTQLRFFARKGDKDRGSPFECNACWKNFNLSLSSKQSLCHVQYIFPSVSTKTLPHSLEVQQNRQCWVYPLCSESRSSPFPSPSTLTILTNNRHQPFFLSSPPSATLFSFSQEDPAVNQTGPGQVAVLNSIGTSLRIHQRSSIVGLTTSLNRQTHPFYLRPRKRRGKTKQSVHFKQHVSITR